MSVPQPGMEPAHPTVEVHSLRHWASGESDVSLAFCCPSRVVTVPSPAGTVTMPALGRGSVSAEQMHDVIRENHAGRKMSNSRDAGVSEMSLTWLTHLNSAVFPAGSRQPLPDGALEMSLQILTPFMRRRYWPGDSRRYMHVPSLFSCVRLFAIPWTAAHQAPLSMGFSRQEPWSGLPCPPPGGPPHPGTEPRSPALAGRFFTICASSEALRERPKVQNSQRMT